MTRTEEQKNVDHARRLALLSLQAYADAVSRLSTAEATRETSSRIGTALSAALRETVGEPVRLI